MANSISLDQFSHQGSGSCPQLIGPPAPPSEHVLESEGLSQVAATPTVIDTDNRIAGRGGQVGRGEERLTCLRAQSEAPPRTSPHLNLPLH